MRLKSASSCAADFTCFPFILEFTVLSSINAASLVFSVVTLGQDRSIRDDPYWTSRKNNLELIELSRINKVSLVQVSSCSNTGSITDDPYCTSRKNSSELMELFSINKVSSVQVSSCSNTGSIRDSPYWTSRKNSLELIELSIIQYKQVY